MYYPYLRGRQFELIALREYAMQRGDNNNIIPIIEPVKNTFNSMKLALPILSESNVKFAFILNPYVGEIKNSQLIVDTLEDELSDNSKWIPTLILSNNYSQINDVIRQYVLHEIMIICSDNTDINSSEFENLISNPQIKYIVTKENRSLKRKLSGSQKELIRLDDNFNKQKKNKDYLNIQDEKFSEEHLFYKTDGYEGFSDYTVLESEFTEGGFLPWAVAIHLTYTKENNEIWIKHFVSDTNEGQSNIQGKFAEAAKKAVEFLNEKKIHTIASEELRKYYNDRTYPGLGMIKKISIKHHLELMNKVLNTSV